MSGIKSSEHGSFRVLDVNDTRIPTLNKNDWLTHNYTIILICSPAVVFIGSQFSR
jgi:hypothetical protein